MKHKTYDNPKLKSKPTLNCVLMYNFYFLCVNISSCVGGLAENILVQNEIKIDFMKSIIFLCAKTIGTQLNTSACNIGTLNHSLYVDL